MNSKDIIAKNIDINIQVSITSFCGISKTISVPAISGYSILCNTNIYSTGIGGLITFFDGNAFSSATPDIYLFNATNNQINNSYAVCHIFTLYKRT